MAEQAEASNVGYGMDLRQGREVGSHSIELRRRGHQRGIGCLVRRLVQCASFQRGTQHPDAERLGQDQHIAAPRARIAHDPVGMDQADHRQPIDRLGRVDRMAARHRYPRLGADRGAAREDGRHGFGRNLAQRHAEDRQRHDRPPAHGIDIGQCIGGGDAAEIARIVDNRHEEIGGGDHRLIVGNAVHGGIVAGLGADQQIWKGLHLGHPGQQLVQHPRRKLAAAAAAMGERSQAGFVFGHVQLSSAVA